MLTWCACPEHDDEKSPITEEAFLAFAASIKSKESFARKSFAYFDKDGSGGVSRGELR